LLCCTKENTIEQTHDNYLVEKMANDNLEKRTTRDASTQTEYSYFNVDKSTSTISLRQSTYRSCKIGIQVRSTIRNISSNSCVESRIYSDNSESESTTENDSDHSTDAANDVNIEDRSNESSQSTNEPLDDEPIATRNDSSLSVLETSFVSEADTIQSKDLDFVPEEEETSSSSDEEEFSSKEISDRCFLVYESKLKELLKFCPKCGSPIDKSQIHEHQNTGSQLILQLLCISGCSFKWKSQPIVGALHGLGNLFLTACITFTGIPFNKFDRFAWLLNLKFFSDSTYYQIRKNFVAPVVHDCWTEEQKKTIAELKGKDKVFLAGDGRCDSPGHSAKYGTYSFLDTQTGKVVNTTVIPVTEVANSNAMEKEGFIRLLRGIQQDSVKVDVVSTDRHVQIRKLMRTDPEFNSIKHEFDPWHLSKSLVKKLTKAAKRKGCEDYHQ